VETESAEAAARVREAYGSVASTYPEEGPRLVIDVDDALGTPDAPPAATLPERDRLVLRGPGVDGAADAVWGGRG
jgi:hypothetical protein